MTNWYVSRDEVKRHLKILDTREDATLDDIIAGVSRQIDRHCGRSFFARSGTRTFTAQSTTRVLLPNDDLLAVTTLKTDEDADLSYATTWLTADYVLLPSNALQESPPQPYWDIRVAPSGAELFPTTLLGVQIVGSWGYYQVLRRAASLLSAAISSTTATTCTVDNAGDFETGQTLKIDSEQVFISNIDNDTLTIERGVNGTTAATHLDNAAIDIYTYPVVSDACRLQCQQEYWAKDARGGVIGSSEMGPIRLAALHPLAMRLLRDFVRQGLA